MDKKLKGIFSLLLILTLFITIVPSAFAADNQTNINPLDNSTKNIISDTSVNNLGTNFSENNQSLVSDNNLETDYDNNELSLNSNNKLTSPQTLLTGTSYTDSITMNVTEVTIKKGDKVNIKGTITGTYQEDIVSGFDDQNLEIDITDNDPIYELDNANTFDYIIDTSSLSAGTSKTYTFGLYSIGGSDISDTIDGCVPQAGYVKVIVESDSSPSTGTTYYVSKTGDDTNNGSLEKPFASIEQAIAANKALGGGSTIQILDGTYNLNETNIYNDITIIGNTSVIIDLQNKNRAFYLGSGAKVNLINLTFINGKSSSGQGGIIYAGNCNLNITNCTFKNSYSGWKGGAIATADSSNCKLTITNSSFVNNTAKSQGGALNLNANSFTITDSVFMSNNVTSSSSKGGAIYIESSQDSDKINYCNFLNNTATSGTNIYSDDPSDEDYGSYTNIDYNYWGNNNKNSLGITGPTVNNWIVLNITSNATNPVAKKDTVKVNVDFTYSTNGTTNTLLTKNMPDLTITFQANIGTINPVTVTTNKGLAESTYTATTNGIATINVNVPNTVYNISFTVGNSYTGIVYVSSNGNNKNNGSYESPKASLSDNTDGDGAITTASTEGGSGKIIILNGTYNEHDLNITSNLNISGNDTVIINGEKLASIFNIHENNINIEFNNIIFINGKSEYGGAINTGNAITNYNATLTFSNCIFENNTATSSGGAIYFNGSSSSNGSLNIINSSFINNTAMYAGALDTSEATIIINSSFINNTASSNGGAIRKNGDLVSINNCIFINNSADKGGALYSTSGNLTIIYSVFLNNTSVNGGSNIYNQMDESCVANYNWWGTNNFSKINQTLSNVTLNNWVILTLTAPDDLFTTEVNNLTVSLNTYTNGTDNGTLNTSLPVREVIFTTDATGTSFNLISSNLTNNTVTVLTPGTIPGNVYATVDNETLSLPINQIVYSWFINDKGYRTLKQAVDAAANGDVIVGIPGTYQYDEINIGQRPIPNYNITEIIKNITIKSNSSTIPVILKGNNDRIFNIAVGSSATLENLILENGSAGYACAIYNNGNLTIINCTISNNHADLANTHQEGGAIESWGNLTILNSVFENNSASQIGGALYINNYNPANVNIINTKFINNTAGTYGGAIYGAGFFNLLLTIDNCSFINNNAIYAGALFLMDNSVIINNCLFENNSALKETTLSLDSDFIRRGGAIMAFNSNLTIKNSNFINNSAEDGGAVYLAQQTTIIYSGDNVTVERTYYNLDNCTFINNNAKGNGGAICSGYITVANGNINNCKFINNTALGNGGAIANCASNMSVFNSTFQNNKASKNAGAIYNMGTFNGLETFIGNLTLKQDIFIDNTANNGGAINSNTEYNNCNVTYSAFINNKANIGNDIVYYKNLSNDFNWYGDNIPLNDNRIYSSYINNYTNPETWVIMSFTADINTLLSGENTSLTVTLNQYYNESTQKVLNLKDSIPTRNVIFSGSGSFNPASSEIKGSLNTLFTAPATEGIVNTYATIDGETLSIPMNITSLSPTKTNTSLNASFNDNILTFDLTANNTGLNDKNITVTISSANGTKTLYTLSTDKNGRVNLDLSNYTTDEYTVDYNYHGDNTYGTSSGSLNLSVSNSVKLNNTILNGKTTVNIINGQAYTYTVTLTDVNGKPLSNKTVSITISQNSLSKTYNISTDNYGVASLPITLNIGDYTIYSIFNEDSHNLASNNVTCTLEVNKIENSLTINNLSETLGSGDNLTGKLLDSLGNPIIGQHIALNLTNPINGASKVYWATTDSEGEYQLEIDLSAGTYTATASYGNLSTDNVNIIVSNPGDNHTSTVLSADKYNQAYNTHGNFTGKLLDLNGNPIIGQHIALKLINPINGESKVYWASTDSEGEYQLEINLAHGEYTAYCSYSGTSIYSPSNAYNTIKVN